MNVSQLYNGLKLSTGNTDDALLPRLVQAINYANEIEITVSFIQLSGLQLLFEALMDAVQNNCTIRLLTSDYLSITNPKALRQLMLLQERGAKIKVFSCEGNTSFHMKSYIFIHSIDEKIDQACAYVGSNNISRSALLSGHEWCLRYDYEAGNSQSIIEFKHIRKQFDTLFYHQAAIELNHQWIDEYQLRYIKNNPTKQLFDVTGDKFEDVPENIVPNSSQTLALQALNETRTKGFKRGLVVLATGMGKTWLAAFDVKQFQAKKVLFVAHREEILLQAEKTFTQLLDGYTTGLYNAELKQQSADFLFASIQTIGKAEQLSRFPIHHFDYIIIDEFHHASSPSYKKLLEHFQAEFLLGLTATPERSDQADILSLCDNNLVFERNLVHGIEEKILVPFNYYGIYDSYVDYEEIPWRNGKFDPEKLNFAFATRKRADHILQNWQKRKQSRTLAFCVSKKHADYMAAYFNKKGIKSVSVHSDSRIRRNEALNLLETNQLEIIFSVDLFNEGMDLPAIDTVLMIRPTESKVLFLQQLGRGLRQSANTGKSRLVVLDFIGNHRSFLNRPAALLDTGNVKEVIKTLNQPLNLAEGCFINYEPKIIDFWSNLAKKYRATAKEEYQSLKSLLGHRPTAAEFFQQGCDISKVRKEHGSWAGLVAEQENDKKLSELLEQYQSFLLKTIETGSMTKSFKCILLEAFLELDGFTQPPSTLILAEKSWHIINRMPDIKQADLPKHFLDKPFQKEKWHRYWLSNPINAFVGGNKIKSKTWFTLHNDRFCADLTVDKEHLQKLHELMQELVDYKLSQYVVRLSNNQRQSSIIKSAEILPFEDKEKIGFKIKENVPNEQKYQQYLPYYPLEIAAGNFAESEINEDIKQWVDIDTIGINRSINKEMFISQIHGHSMEPLIPDGSYCLFKYGVTGTRQGRIVLVQKSGYTDPDTNASFTIKRYYSEKSSHSQFGWQHKKIELRPENPEYQILTIEEDEADDFMVIAEFLQVLDIN